MGAVTAAIVTDSQDEREGREADPQDVQEHQQAGARRDRPEPTGSEAGISTSRSRPWGMRIMWKASA